MNIQIATFLGDASVATLAYAQRIYTLPLSLFGVAVAQVALPALAHEAAGPGTGEGEPRPEALRDELSRSWQRMAFLILPSTVGLVAFGRPAVSLLFERGRFQAADTTAVSWVLAAYAAGLLAYGSARLLATAFYAFHDTRTPVRIGALALAVNVVLGVGLAWLMGTPGIALATYGGAMFLFPPRPVADIWRDPRFDFTDTLEERLLAAACHYAAERHLALLAHAPPGAGWRRLAKKFGKKLVHVPLAHFSQETVQQLRMFHVLNGQQVRSFAEHFIRRA